MSDSKKKKRKKCKYVERGIFRFQKHCKIKENIRLQQNKLKKRWGRDKYQTATEQNED